MNPACDFESVNEAFRLARDQFETMIYQLHSDPTAQMEHDQVEALINTDFRAKYNRHLNITL
jgi:hypothetical protein